MISSENTTEQTKLCSHCRQEKPVSAFSINNKAKDGYQYICKACQSEIRRKTGPVNGLNPELAAFQPRHLIEELRARGYKGKLYYTHEITL